MCCCQPPLGHQPPRCPGTELLGSSPEFRRSATIASDSPGQATFDTEIGQEPSTPPQVVDSADRAINREQLAFCPAGAGDSLDVLR